MPIRKGSGSFERDGNLPIAVYPVVFSLRPPITPGKIRRTGSFEAYHHASHERGVIKTTALWGEQIPKGPGMRAHVLSVPAPWSRMQVLGRAPAAPRRLPIPLSLTPPTGNR